MFIRKLFWDIVLRVSGNFSRNTIVFLYKRLRFETSTFYTSQTYLESKHTPKMSRKSEASSKLYIQPADTAWTSLIYRSFSKNFDQRALQTGRCRVSRQLFSVLWKREFYLSFSIIRQRQRTCVSRYNVYKGPFGLSVFFFW